MTSLVPGHIHAFGLGTNYALFWNYTVTPEGGWSAYHPVGGKWKYEPIVVSRVVNELSVFLVNDNGELHQANFDVVNMGDLGPWKNLGGKPVGPPAVAKRHPGIIHIFFIGTDKAIHHKWWNGLVYLPTADEYEKLAGEYTLSPTAVSTGANDVSVFAIGLDNQLYHYRWLEGVGWSGLEKLPGHWTSSPKAVSDGLGRIDVFGLDLGNGKDWSLHSIPASFVSLEAISITPGCIDFFGVTDVQTICHRTLKEGSWGAWEDLKGMMTKPPTAVSYLPDVLGVIGLGVGGVAFYKQRDPRTGYWGGWVSVGGTLITRVG